ncbi:MAG: MarR family transcriptional regulator, partial [Paenisporosarcina sp.]
VVDKLEKKKFVDRKECPFDRRVTYASLTSLGKEFSVPILPQHRMQ